MKINAFQATRFLFLSSALAVLASCGGGGGGGGSSAPAVPSAPVTITSANTQQVTQEAVAAALVQGVGQAGAAGGLSVGSSAPDSVAPRTHILMNIVREH